MMSPATARLLARCNGFDVTAEGDLVGTVATPVFSGTSVVPDFLLVRVAETIPGVFRAFTTDQIAAIDAAAENVELELTVGQVVSSPEPVDVDDLREGWRGLRRTSAERSGLST